MTNEINKNSMPLKEKISLGSKSEWFFDFHEYTIITRDVLDRFGLNEEEPTFVSKILRLKIPVEEISRIDKRLFLYNDISKEMREKPHKKTWFIMKTKNFKRALFLTGGTRLTTELRKYYLDLEDIVREHVKTEKKSMKEHEMIEAAIENALRRYTVIIDDKIISQLAQ